MQRSSVVAGVLALALFCNPAVAQSNIYVFGSFGNTDAEVSLGGLNQVDDDNRSYAVGAGYVFTPNVSLDVAYIDFGSHNGETDCPPDFASLIIPVSAKADFTGISAAFDDSGEDVFYGAGLRWSVGDHWKVFAEYEKQELDLDTADIGVRYYF